MLTPQRVDELHAVHQRHLQIGDHKLRPEFFGRSHSFDAIRGDSNFVARGLQQALDHAGLTRAVFNYQQARHIVPYS